MTQISTLASSTRMLGFLNAGQEKLKVLQTSVSTGMVSQTYAGLGGDTSRLLSLETTKSITVRFSENNALMQGRLKMVDTAVSSVDKAMRDFREVLVSEGGADPLDETNVARMQEAAFRALENMEMFLNTEVDGRYLFSGSQVTTEPVDFGLTTLEDFQARYDGARVSYPTTREAHLERFSIADDGAGNAAWLTFERDSTGTGGPGRINGAGAQFANIAPGTTITLSGTPGGNNDGTFTVAAVDPGGAYIDVVSEYFVNEVTNAATITDADGTLLDNAALGDLTFATGPFQSDPDTVSATTAGSLASLTPGSTFTVSGSTSNDGTYTVLANDGTTMTIESKKLVGQGLPGFSEVAGTVSASSYYAGDTVAHRHAVNDQRGLSQDLTAIDPAFEKAIRAMGLIAQGTFGSEGGLDANPRRVQDALYLMNSAIEKVVNGPPPFGAEKAGNIDDVRIEIGFQQVVLQDALDLQKELIGRYEMQTVDLEQVDTMEAVTKLLDQSTALEASMQALSRVRQLNLVNFL